MSKVSSYLKRRVKGFTLIELLIVITIIGILAVALIPRIASSPARARDVQRKADLNNIASALELYYSDNGAYPVETTGDCVSTLAITAYVQGGIPDDPSSLVALNCAGGGYGYISNTDGSGYIINAQLEVTTASGDNVCSVITGSDANDLACTAYNGADGTDPYYYLAR